ncbi:hypothetical protein DY000_02025047 [Brassica cretica]|uniref:Secreted protein n=1 Tax=Brassica cretica TaxID=69181 RepID=A0ABQ7EH77_BRACR|nr:hypothetical protein DY000_02025047 [Brassica cretica]
MTVRFNGLIPVKLLLLASSEQISRRQTTACVLYEGCPLHHFSIATVISRIDPESLFSHHLPPLIPNRRGEMLA